MTTPHWKGEAVEIYDEPRNPNGLTMMFVEDSEAQSLALSLMLENRGFRVLAFLNLEEAKAYHAEHAREIAFVFCDGSLQVDNDGIAWSEELHAQGYDVLLCSSNDYKGGVRYLSKMVNNEVLFSTIAEMTGVPVELHRF